MAWDADDAKATIAAFMRRAERIMSTAAAQREDLATIGSTMTVLLRLDSRVQNIHRTHLPIPELIEAAAVVRPFVMDREPSHVGKVVNAVSFLTQGAPTDVRELVSRVKSTWPRLLAGERWVVMVAHSDGSQPTRLTDVEMAELWLNAHVWHDDQDKQWALRNIAEDECRISATVWVSDRVLLARAIQQMIVDLRRAGHLPG